MSTNFIFFTLLHQVNVAKSNTGWMYYAVKTLKEPLHNSSLRWHVPLVPVLSCGNISLTQLEGERMRTCFLCPMIRFAWVLTVAASSHSPAWDRLTIPPSSVCLLPVENCFEYTQRLQEITFGLCLLFFQGQKPGLTDVQAELDRMTRKQDSMVSANNVPPPTGNEAWRQQKHLSRPLR